MALSSASSSAGNSSASAKTLEEDDMVTAVIGSAWRGENRPVITWESSDTPTTRGEDKAECHMQFQCRF